MAEHTDEPHVHTLTFTDDAGQAFSVDVDCPSSLETFGETVVSTGATSVNALAVDGKQMPFTGLFERLAGIGRADLIGKSYQTPDNLFKVFVAMGTNEPEEATPA